MLTSKKILGLPIGIFEHGTTENGDTWAAVRGGYSEWCIYVGHKDQTPEDATVYGDKVHSQELIKKLLPCDEDALAMYRH